MYQNIPTKVRTEECRLSYVFLNTPRRPQNQNGQQMQAQQGQNGQQQERYGVTLLIPKTAVRTYNEIQAAIKAAADDAVTAKWNGVRPPVIKHTLHDGDGVREDSGLPFGDECKGHWVITANSNQKPQVVQFDANGALIPVQPQDIYSGMYAEVTLNFKGYLFAGKRGVTAYLGNVLKTRDGEPLSGGASADADFGVPMATQSDFAPAAPAAPVPGQRINPITGLPM